MSGQELTPSASVSRRIEVGPCFGPRSSGERWEPSDRRLLADLARQAGAVVQGLKLTADFHRLTVDLQHSRGQLVLSREEEHRRLRSDLHDDLAPTLAALSSFFAPGNPARVEQRRECEGDAHSTPCHLNPSGST